MTKAKELKYGNTRCYCINNKLLIDTDWAGTLPAFFKCIKDNHIAMNEIKYLIVTHFHPDHMGIAQELVDLGVKLIVFEEQKSYIHCSDSIFAKDKIMRFKPIVDDEVFYLSCAESRNFLSKIGISGEVIHTIGHGDDSVSIILDDGIAIVGDLYPLHTISAYNNNQLNESWNRILSHNIKEIRYGHFKEDFL